jgi:hypothetical protein
MPPEYNPLGEDWIDPGLGGFLMSAGYTSEEYNPEMGKFKVPTLRNVDLRPGNGFTKAYMHNGVFKSLKEVVHFYNTRDDGTWPPPEYPYNVNEDELGALGLTDAEEDAIVAFMKTLSDGYKLPKTDPIAQTDISLVMTCRNPVSSNTQIMFNLPESSNVTIEVYSLTGQLVSTLFNGSQPAGSNTLQVAMDEQPAGIYILRLNACNQSVSKKITVVR